MQISSLVLAVQDWRCGLEKLLRFCPAFHLILLWLPGLIWWVDAKERLLRCVNTGFPELGPLAWGFLGTHPGE